MSTTDEEPTYWRIPGNHDNTYTSPDDTTVYHTDRDCPYLQNTVSDPIPTTPAEVERIGLRVCKACEGSIEINPGIYGDCPFCGETVARLPSHLPHCEESP